MKIGYRKMLVGVFALLVATAGMFLGAIPCFAFLQGHVEDFLETIVWITGLFMAGNVGAKALPGAVNKLVGKVDTTT